MGSLLYGVICKYISTEWPWWLENGIFKVLEPQQEVINAIKELISKGYEVYILTAYHKSTPQVKEDKLFWFKKFTPFISEENIIFCYCGENKADYIPTGITENDILLDDFNTNLISWQNCQGQSVKVLNGINSKDSWNGLSVSAFDKDEIVSVFKNTHYGYSFFYKKIQLFLQNSYILKHYIYNKIYNKNYK